MFTAISLSFIAVCVWAMPYFAGRALKGEKTLTACFASVFLFLLPVAIFNAMLFFLYGFDRLFDDGKHTIEGALTMYFCLLFGTPLLSSAMVYKERQEKNQ